MPGAEVGRALGCVARAARDAGVLGCVVMCGLWMPEIRTNGRGSLRRVREEELGVRSWTQWGDHGSVGRRPLRSQRAQEDERERKTRTSGRQNEYFTT